MALITANQLMILSMKGQLGNVVLYPHPFKPGVYILRGKGRRTKKSTSSELAGQEKFRLANLYAQMAQNDPAYQAAREKTHRTAFNLAMANFLNVPAVQEIDLSGYSGKAGEAIRIEALDDFEVARVQARILEPNGTVLEEGEAARVRAGKRDWVYFARTNVLAGQTVVVEITAWDDPGNTAVRKADHVCGPRVV